ncbi:MAG: hypothetical protein PUF12_04205 [Thermoflexaceae bacterium]|nr:hypothetical protein [Thermoflexaceae bacterium]
MKKKKYLKWMLLLILFVLIFAGTVKRVRLQMEQNNQDEIVLRFAVASKTFVLDESNTSLLNFINKVYDYADHSEYPYVDAFIVNGNVTGDGSEEAFQAVDKITSENLRKESGFYTAMGEMDFIVGENDKVDDPAIREKIADRVVTIKGFSFVFLSPIYSSYAEKLDWLDEQLGILTKYNEKAVFVFQHAALKDTFYGTENWYTIESMPILDVLEKYPQVVDFASASGTAANTVRSIYQKNATYVNTGTLSQIRMNYQEFGYDTSNEVINSTAASASQCKIVEVYGDGRVEIMTMDINTGNIYRTPMQNELMKQVVYPGKTEKYLYTREMNVSQDVPAFAENAKVEILSSGTDHVEISFANAEDKDGILFYRMLLSDSAGNFIREMNTYSDFVLYEQPQRKNYVIEGLSGRTNYYLEIIPYDMFGVAGKSISVDFITAE